MDDEIRDERHESNEDHNDEVVEEHTEHLMEEDNSDEVDGDYSDEEELDYEYDDEEEEEEEEESQDEEEDEGLMNEDSENGVETASLCGDEQNAGGGGLNRGEIDGLFCPICMEAWTNGGDHQVCCLPCGHIYGLSCIKTWIQRNRSSRKCPQCNQKCSLKDVRVLYASRIVAVDEELRKKVQSLEAKCASLKKRAPRESTRADRQLIERLEARGERLEQRFQSLVAAGFIPSTATLCEDEDEDEEEEEEEGLINEDSENGVETAALCGNEENAGGGGLNRGEIDGLFCPICMEAWTNGGDHQVCCLPCGHIYGLSCIKTWIQRDRSSRKCPQCNRKCLLKDVRVLYASRIVAVDEELRKKVQSLKAKCASLKKKALRELTTADRQLMERLERRGERLKQMFQSLMAAGAIPSTSTQ